NYHHIERGPRRFSFGEDTLQPNPSPSGGHDESSHHGHPPLSAAEPSDYASSPRQSNSWDRYWEHAAHPTDQHSGCGHYGCGTRRFFSSEFLPFTEGLFH